MKNKRDKKGVSFADMFKSGGYCVLAVFAHPDDEIVTSGTLARLKSTGNYVHLLYLTHGEDGPTGGLVEKSKLGEARLDEINEVAKVLKSDTLTVLDFPDRYLNTMPKERVKAAILNKIDQVKPDVVVSFDTSLGLYGHTDHLMCGICALDATMERGHIVKQHYMMTLSPVMLRIALKLSHTFRKNYQSSDGLPKPTCSVRISRYGKQKNANILCHKTQWQVLSDVQPYYDKIPYNLYYRLLSREYFCSSK